MNDFETIRTFDDLITANLALQKLEANGITCYLADENTISIDWMLRNAVGGIKLRVLSSDIKDALKILEEPNEEIDIDHSLATGNAESIVCPNCKSNNVSKEKYSTKILVLTWITLGFPLLMNPKKYHRCYYCGHKWSASKSTQREH